MWGGKVKILQVYFDLTENGFLLCSDQQKVGRVAALRVTMEGKTVPTDGV